MLSNSCFAKLLLLIFFIACLAACNSNNKSKQQQAKANTVKSFNYKFDILQGWTTEHIPFPIEFAQTINYTGVEDLRFTKGWGDALSEEHWTYAFLWWLDGKPKIDATIIQENLTTYYTGLVQRNIQQRSIPQIKLVPTTATIKQVENAVNDVVTYKGSISMLDYITQNPIILNCIIHVKNCDVQKHTAVITEISPKPYDHVLWKQLEGLHENFKCE